MSGKSFLLHTVFTTCNCSRLCFSFAAPLNSAVQSRRKILYMYMLGYEVDFGHMEAVNLISSAKYSEKSVGYAWCALMLREGDELLRLIINSIRSDLISKQDNAICLALNSICNVGGKEFAEALAPDVLSLLTANSTRTYVRKKAALTTLRLYRKSPDMLPANEWAERILVLLDEKNIGVLTSVSSLVLGILAVDTQGWDSCAAKVSGLAACESTRRCASLSDWFGNTCTCKSAHAIDHVHTF